MAAKLIDIAEAVKDAINAATFTTAITAARTYGPADITTTAEALTVRCDVQPASASPTIITRGRDQTAEFRVLVGIRRRVPITNGEISATHCDDTILLFEEVIKHLAETAKFADGSLENIEIDQPYQADTFERAAVFYGSIELIIYGSF